MKKFLVAVASITLGAAIWLAPEPVLAHHAFSAEYDAAQPITLKGAIVSMEWVNPHVWLHISVKDPSGTATQWALEFGSPNNLYKNGWRKDDLPIGAEVTVTGFKAKDGSPIANARSVVLGNGKKLFSGSPDTGAPGDPK